MERPTTSGSLTAFDVPPGTFGDAVIRPNDAAYDEARRVWNGMIDRRPAAIVRCRDAAEVRSAVVAARAQGLPIDPSGAQAFSLFSS